MITASGLAGGSTGAVSAGGALWSAAGAAAGGAILTGGLAAGACADAAIDRINAITEDFCACLSKNDCPPHKWCKKKKGGGQK